MERNDFDKALNLAYYYLKFRPRTRREIELYLEKRANKYRFSPEVISGVLDQLIEQQYVDDKKFIEMYVGDRLAIKPRSIFLMKQELARLGVAKNLIDAYFDVHTPDDAATAVNLLQKRLHTFSRLPARERFTKAVSFLRRKGFSYSDSVSAYRTVVGKDENPFEE